MTALLQGCYHISCLYVNLNISTWYSSTFTALWRTANKKKRYLINTLTIIRGSMGSNKTISKHRPQLFSHMTHTFTAQTPHKLVHNY